jgi:hypothetical protein
MNIVHKGTVEINFSAEVENSKDAVNLNKLMVEEFDLACQRIKDRLSRDPFVEVKSIYVHKVRNDF